GRGPGRFGRLAGSCGRPGGGPTGEGSGRRRRARGGRAEGTPPLVAVLAAGQVLGGALIQDHELLGRFVHPHGDHGQALCVFLLALRGHAVVILLRSFGMQFGPARNTLRHYLFSELIYSLNSITNVHKENTGGARHVPVCPWLWSSLAGSPAEAADAERSVWPGRDAAGR